MLTELVDSGDLGSWLKHRSGKTPKAYFEPPEVLAMLGQMASGVQYLHEKHIVHRDIKPDNFLLMSNGVVKLSDFGLSKPGFMHSQLQHTANCGTPLYLAPEVFALSSA